MRVWWMAWAALALTGSTAFAQPAGGSRVAGEPVAGPPPNIVLMMTDDLEAQEMRLGFGRVLAEWDSALRTRLIDQGVSLDNFFNTTPLCCPSRASYLTGQYSHHHGVWGNNYTATDGNGGWRRFWELGHEAESLGSWMQAEGYHTALIGKFMNGYPNLPGGFVPEDYVPLGWSEWYATMVNDEDFSYFDFRMNHNGELVSFGGGEEAYLTDVERDLAVDYLERIAPLEQPFFLLLTPYAPHAPTQPAPRHEGTYLDMPKPPRPPSFNEEDLSDKPEYIQEGAVVWPNWYGNGTLRKLDMTLAVDEYIEAVLGTLENLGELDNTYFIFVSDNGLMRGQHGIGGKSVPYEESIRVPMLVRGPGVPAGVRRSHLVLNIDLAPTILELAGAAATSEEIDGESIVALLGDPETVPASEEWRDVVMVELRTTIASSVQEHVVPPYFGVRAARHCMASYEPGDLELYDLVTDPFELESAHLSAPPELLGSLADAIVDLAACAGASCRDATRRGWPRVSWVVTCDGLACSFDATTSFDPDGDIASYTWDFGDGTAGEGKVIEHVYGGGGIFRVSLTVLDDGDNPTIGTETLEVAVLFADGFESGDLAAWSLEE